MKIEYRIAINPDIIQQKILNDLGVINPEGTGFFVFKLEEHSEAFMKLKPYLDKWGVLCMAESTFSKVELDNSTLLQVNCMWINGYPQPENDFEYRKTTYSESDYCSSCGMGLIQKAPFRLLKSPNWGTKSMFQLNWINDEIFVSKSIYDEVFKRFGVLFKSVELHKKNIIIEDTLQLLIPETTVSLNLEGFPFEICKKCERKKYNPQIKGYFPSLNETEKSHIFRTKEYFGSGHVAFQKILISQELRQAIMKYKGKLDYIPCTAHSQK